MTIPRVQKPGTWSIIMVGTGVETMGGISAVVKGYLSAGLFDRFPIVYVKSHSDGTPLRKFGIAVSGFAGFLLTLTRRNVRLVHVHLSSRASFWRKLPFAVTCKLLRVPLLLHLHGSEFMTFYQEECGPMRRRVITFIFDQSAAVIVLSPQWAENVRKITANPNVHTIFNGVSVADWQPQRAHDREPATILFLGRLGRRKGIYDLLDALVSVKKWGTAFRLIAAGDGEIAEVAERAHELGLASFIELPGWINDEGKNSLLEQADIFVLPSHAEGLPMSLLEALAAGLPVVCSSVGGIPTAVTDGAEGFIVSPGDVRALAEALNHLLRDKELRARCGRMAFERAKHDFDIRQSVEQLIALYDQHGRS